MNFQFQKISSSLNLVSLSLLSFMSKLKMDLSNLSVGNRSNVLMLMIKE